MKRFGTHRTPTVVPIFGGRFRQKLLLDCLPSKDAYPLTPKIDVTNLEASAGAAA